MMKIFKGKSIGDPKYAPVKGTAFNQFFYFNKLHDYHAQVAKIHPTYRLLTPNQSDQLYTIDVRNIEHVLKTNFDKYSRGKYSQDIMIDLFGEGIFAVDGDKWKQQRKVASYEFSTRVLRDFSCSVFRKNAAKLVRVISEFYHEGLPFDMQVSNIIIYFLKLLLLSSYAGAQLYMIFINYNMYSNIHLTILVIVNDVQNCFMVD
jgi:hypothetical protein